MIFLKHISKTLVFGILIVVSSVANASYEAVSKITTVEIIYASPRGGSPFITFGVNSMEDCYGESGAYLSGGGETVDRVLSMLLAAQSTGNKVQVYYNKNAESNGWGKCTIYSIRTFSRKF